jgi:hypothetical protein
MGSKTFYEELLTLGQHLHERERLALYKFLTKNKENTYKSDAIELLHSKELKSSIANGEILYVLKNNVVSYSVRKNGSSVFEENVRQVKLHDFSRLQIKKLNKFFAQTEVEVIWNYPLEGRNFQEEGSYCIHSYPYFDLRYFSNGGSRLVGLVNKMKTNDKELLTKLRAL